MCFAEARVSFHAFDLKNQQPAVGETLVFPYIDHNEGGGYDASTGVFTAPRAGTYLFLATLQGWGSQAGADTVRVVLVQDGLVQQYVVTEADRENDWESTSLQAVLRLAAGSTVWLRALGNQNRFHEYTAITFSGILVTPYF